MEHSFLSAFVLLLLVLDPFGSLPIFIAVMGGVDPQRRRRVALREIAVAFFVLVIFMACGRQFLDVMHLSDRSLEVAGGVILMIIAIRMIFGGAAKDFGPGPSAPEPIVFPLAVPMLAGPSAMATVLLLASRQPEKLTEWIVALSMAMAATGAALICADRIHRWLGDSMVLALEKLMGLVLTAMAVEMVLAGLKHYFTSGA